jgi:hypothetical protein
MGQSSNDHQQRRGQQWRARAITAAAVALAAGALLTAGHARADVTIGEDWTPTTNSNGYTYFDGFTDYADGAPTTLLQQVDRGGNKWLQYTNTNGQYWGQLVGQGWANSNVLPSGGINDNPHLEFDVDLSQYTWGRLMVRVDYSNSIGGTGNPQAGSMTVDLSQLVAKNKATLTSTPNPFIEHVSIDLSPLGFPRDTAADTADFAMFLQPNFWGYWDQDANAGAGQFVGGTYSPQTFLIDHLRLTADPVKVNASWNVDADGSWPTGQTGAGTATWAGGTPNGAGHTANFMAVTNYDSGQNTINAHTVTVDAPVTIGVINFNNPNSYTIAGPATLTLQGAVGVPAGINVAQGSHTISAPLNVNDDATFTTASGSGLTLSNLQPGTHALTKAGGGALSVNNVRAGALSVNAGTVGVVAGRSAAGTSKVGALTVAPGATLDLADQDLIVDYSGTSPFASIQSAIQSGFNAGSWNGTGIKSSSAATGLNGHATALGYAEASSVGIGSGGGTFSGQAVDNTSVLVRYTYAGDSNIDGKVDLTDFTFLAANFNGTGKNWLQGDYNYDGKVDLTDFTFLAANFNQSLTGDGGGLGSAVPEPVSLAALATFGVVAVGMRRGRRRVVNEVVS